MAPRADGERAPLTARDLNRATLARQGLLEPFATDPADAVRGAGSLQAQHPEWPPVALASRAADRSLNFSNVSPSWFKLWARLPWSPSSRPIAMLCSK